MRFALVFLIMMTRHWIQMVVQSHQRAKMLAKVILVVHSFATLMALQLWLESFPGALNVIKKVILVFTAMFNTCMTGSNKISTEINDYYFWSPRRFYFKYSITVIGMSLTYSLFPSWYRNDRTSKMKLNFSD